MTAQPQACPQCGSGTALPLAKPKHGYTHYCGACNRPQRAPFPQPDPARVGQDAAPPAPPAAPEPSPRPARSRKPPKKAQAPPPAPARVDRPPPASRRILICDRVRITEGEHAGKCGQVIDKLPSIADQQPRPPVLCIRIDGELTHTPDGRALSFRVPVEHCEHEEEAG